MSVVDAADVVAFLLSVRLYASFMRSEITDSAELKKTTKQGRVTRIKRQCK